MRIIPSFEVAARVTLRFQKVKSNSTVFRTGSSMHDPLGEIRENVVFSGVKRDIGRAWYLAGKDSVLR